MKKASVLSLLTLMFGLVCYGHLRAPMQAEEAASAPTATSAPDELDKATYVLCKLGRQIRSLRIDQSSGNCKAYYTKQGVDQEVGKSSDLSLCFKVTNRIRRNLQSGDWKCRDASSSKTSFFE